MRLRPVRATRDPGRDAAGLPSGTERRADPNQTAVRRPFSAARSARRLGVAALVLTALGIAACAAGTAPSGTASSPASFEVVATTTVLADLVAQVGGGRVAVTALVPKGGEVHTFDPTPSDARRLVGAQLIVANGLGLDDWLTRLAADAGSQAPIVRVAENLPGATYLTDPDGTVNPHLWLDVENARRYAARIAAELGRVDPAGAATYTAAAARYDVRLADLDTWIRSQVGAIPAPNRRVVSSHEAFPYYAAAYGIDVVDVIVPAPGQEPSAAQIAHLIEAIRAAGVRAILAEAQFNPALAERIATETGVPVVTNLYSDSVGDPPAETYDGLMRWDTERIVEALR